MINKKRPEPTRRDPTSNGLRSDVSMVIKGLKVETKNKEEGTNVSNNVTEELEENDKKWKHIMDKQIKKWTRR